MPVLRIGLGLTGAFLLGGALLSGGSQTARAAPSQTAQPVPLQASCQLNSVHNKIKRVIYLNFDNVHFRRDNPNVPSDLEQMPNLLNFILQNGTIATNHWTPLISHTSVDLLTAMTGVYGDRMGMPVGNSYGFFRADGSVGIGIPSFLYWTATAADGKPHMVNELGKTHPAPWVPFARAGCDVGAFSVANIVFERLPDDVRTFFGVGSPEDQAVTAALALPDTPPNQPARNAPNTDYLGIAIHCAQGSPLCNNSNARPDVLADEPGGYSGFMALFGNVNVAPAVCPANNCKDLDGNVIADAYGRPGFPNVFNPTATQSLGYAAAMLEAGVPVIFVYVADAHDRNPLPLDPTTNKPTNNRAFGPGEAEYVNQLRNYDIAFGKFFARLAADGIDQNNTLFVIVPDENDHFVGSAPNPANCDGVTTPCTYSAVSEINAHLNRLLRTQRNNTTPFFVHSDDAPTIYITGNPSPTAAVTRTFEKDLDALTAVNPITGATDKLSVFLADQAEMKLLHMVTASPARTPSLTMFGDPNYFFFNSSNTNCAQPPTDCVFLSVPPAATFAWNHGDVQSDITNTWMAMVGPGVLNRGADNSVFSDHTDVRPTMLTLLGLKDSYIHDGRLLAEKLSPSAVPPAVQGSAKFASLAAAYKQLNATLGALSLSSMTYANRSIISDDATYANYLSNIATITSNRDALASSIKTLLDAATFYDQPISDSTADSLTNAAQVLIAQVRGLANPLPSTHDLNGDGISDILFRNTGGGIGAWLLNNNAAIQSAVGIGSLDNNWAILGQRRLNGDRVNDLLFRYVDGSIAEWLLNTNTAIASAMGLGNPSPNWNIVGTGDFNNDGIGDILFRGGGTAVAIWYMNSSGVVQSMVGVGSLPNTWTVAGTGDFDGDGVWDILWSHSSGAVAVWLMNSNGTIKSPVGLGSLPPATWSVGGTGDFDGDGIGDILWRDLSGNSVAIWFMNTSGGIRSAQSVGMLPSGWTIAETGDFNGDAKSDILLYHSASGSVGAWLMNGAAITSSVGIGSLPPASWTVVTANSD